jgi:hypothetical protein
LYRVECSVSRLWTIVRIVLGGVSAAGAQDAKVRFLSPADSVQKRSSAPAMRVKLISSGEESKQYAVIFTTGDEAYSGLLDFADNSA